MSRVQGLPTESQPAGGGVLPLVASGWSLAAVAFSVLRAAIAWYFIAHSRVEVVVALTLHSHIRWRVFFIEPPHWGDGPSTAIVTLIDRVFVVLRCDLANRTIR